MLKGKNIIVTGARRGIGRATVGVCASLGANVWACARNYDESFEKEMNLIAQEKNVEIWPTYFDVADEKQVKEAVKEIRNRKKEIDALVNVAGIVGHKLSFPMISMEQMREVMDINFFAATNLAQYISRVMVRQRKGNIVFVSSIAGLDGTPSQYPYAASKSAFIGATKNLARELAEYNIRVNTVAPGIIDTGMAEMIEDRLKQEMLGKMMIKRMGKPEEVANVIAFLVSDLSSYMTGQIIRVDGGV